MIEWRLWRHLAKWNDRAARIALPEQLQFAAKPTLAVSAPLAVAMTEAVAPAYALGAGIMTMAHDVWATDHSTGYSANDRARRSSDHSAGACTYSYALQCPSLGHDGRGR